MDAPRPTLKAPADELLELVQGIRRALAHRYEAPTGDWVDAVVEDLRVGRKAGWYYPPSLSGGGLAFVQLRDADGFGHVHVGEGPEPEERAVRLAERLLDGLPAPIRSVDVGFTGLAPQVERRVMDRLAAHPGSTVIERVAMERALGPADGTALAQPPDGLHRVPLTDITLDALADLDRRAFAGTLDELLIGSSPEDHRRSMRAILEGGMGRFLPEASVALIVPEPARLVGAILSAEQSPQRAVFLNFMVDPEYRGRGYGRDLFRWGLRALWALGYARVHLWVTVANRSARSLYEAEGLRPVASAVIYRWERPSTDPHPQSSR